MSDDKIQRVTRTELEKRYAELQGEDRYMTLNDQLLHVEVQEALRDQHQQGLNIARLQVTVDQLVQLVDSMVLDRGELSAHVRRLQSELEQMHVRQTATDARLETIKTVFDSGLEDIREVNKKIAEFVESGDIDKDRG